MGGNLLATSNAHQHWRDTKVGGGEGRRGGKLTQPVFTSARRKIQLGTHPNCLVKRFPPNQLTSTLARSAL